MTDANENPKLQDDPGSNTDTIRGSGGPGDDPMTGAQASYLKTLSEEAGKPDMFATDLSKAEASKRIDALKGGDS